MLFELVLFFTIATALTTLAVMVDHVVRSRAWLGIPVGLVIMATAAWLTGLIAHDPGASLILPIIAIVATALARALLRRWSILSKQIPIKANHHGGESSNQDAKPNSRTPARLPAMLAA